jgi:hypothetical protein
LQQGLSPVLVEDICRQIGSECTGGKTCMLDKFKEVARNAGWNDPTTTYDQIVTCDRL